MNGVEGVEAAASLFGSEEPSSDPFASLGSDTVPSQQTPSSEGEFPYNPTLFEGQINATELPAEGDTAIPFQSNHDVQHPPSGEDYFAKYSSGQTTYSNLNNVQSDSYAFEEDQWNDIPREDRFVDSQHTALNAHDGNVPPANFVSYAPASSYAVPQVPASATNPSVYSKSTYSQPTFSGNLSSHHGSYPATHSTGGYPSYNSYNVPFQQEVSPHVPSHTAPINAAPVHVSSPPRQINSLQQPTSFVSATINRPKVTNAYDPPFPTTTSSRRHASARNVAGQQAYNTYSAYQQQPLPPPVRSSPENAHSLPQSEYSIPLGQSRANGGSVYVHPTATGQYDSTLHRPLEAYQQSVPTEDQTTGSDGALHEPSWKTHTQLNGDNAWDNYGKHSETGPYSSLNNEFHDYRTSSADPKVDSPSAGFGVGSPASVQRIQSLHDNSEQYTGTLLTQDMAKVPSDPPLNEPSSFTATAASQFPYDNNDNPSDVSKSLHSNNSSQFSTPLAANAIYEPKISADASLYIEQRTQSPSSISLTNGLDYSSTKPTYVNSPPHSRTRSSPNSTFQSAPPHSDPYAPTSRSNSLAEESNSSFGYTPMSQEVVTKPSSTMYAPSPSLVGANDPLGRPSTIAPVFSFGFGGKLVTCFHQTTMLNTGYDIALSSRKSTNVAIHKLKKIIPESALDISAAYPGPLIGDPGPSTSSIVRPTAAAQIKLKKTQVLKYLEDKVVENSSGVGYMHSGSSEKRVAEAKLMLVKLLKIMVENDGRLLGTPQLDASVRSVLVPRLEESSVGLSDSNGSIVPAYILSSGNSVGSYSTSNEAPISFTSLRPSALDKIEEFLLRGERRQAYHFALDEKLWGHAMVIASSIDKEAWKEVVNEFLKVELRTSNGGGSSTSDSAKRRDSLRVAYSLFSGQGAAAVQELVPQNLLSQATNRIHQGSVTPRTPAFAGVQPVPIPVDSILNWAETAAMMISSPLSVETSAALTALGDQLLANQWIEAAHVCYLLSPQTSPMGGVGNPVARIVLVGSPNPGTFSKFAKASDAFIFTEIVEFALSLAPGVKTSDSLSGLPYLQAYRFIRASTLAEFGDIHLANRYCESIASLFSRGSPYFTPALLEQLKILTDRISGNAHGEKSGSWIGSKLSKPSLDTIGGWLEGRFTKLVTGDVDSSSTVEADTSKTEARPFSGPFAHYSTISSTTPSARSSPQPTTHVNGIPPQRAASAMGNSPYTPAQIDRSASAMDYTRYKTSPGNQGPFTSMNNAGVGNPPSNDQTTSPSLNGDGRSEDLTTPKASHGEDEDQSPVQEATWWGATSYGDLSSNRTPTTATFMQVEASTVGSSSGGFISLMDSHASSTQSSGQNGVEPHSISESKYSPIADDDDELGLGNPKADAKRPVTDEGNKGKVEVTPERPELKPTQAAGGSWLSRWWKSGNDSTPGPIKASLGEESAFYYDKELKRWVNKKAGSAEAEKPSVPPPPPARAQTASPGMGMSGPRGAGPPPNGSNLARAASVNDLNSSSPPPNKPVLRVRSNLVPPPESAPSTPTGSRLSPQGPPPGRPKSQASKRNIRNRYVDVFSQEGGASA